MNLSVLLFMFVFHVVDDFYLQGGGILSKLKQRAWWENNHPDELYKNDYIMALVIHSLTWAIFIMIPLFIFGLYDESLQYYLIGAVFVNTVVHGYVDHLKANIGKINLVMDQSIHFVQIIATWLLFLIII